MLTEQISPQTKAGAAIATTVATIHLLFLFGIINTSAGFRLPILNVAIVDWAVRPMLIVATLLAFASWYGRYFAERRHLKAEQQAATKEVKKQFKAAKDNLESSQNDPADLERNFLNALSNTEQSGKTHQFSVDQSAKEGRQISLTGDGPVSGDEQQRWDKLQNSRNHLQVLEETLDDWRKKLKKLQTADLAFGARAKLLYVYSPTVLCIGAFFGGIGVMVMCT